MEKDWVRYPITGEPDGTENGTMTTVYIYGWDKQRGVVKCTPASAVLYGGGSKLRIEIHHADGCVSRAYVATKDINRVGNLKRGTLGNKGKRFDVCTRVYGQYPMYSMTQEYTEWYRRELWNLGLIK